MAENFVSMEEAQNNLLSCATFLADDVKSAEGYSEAMKAIVPLYIGRGDVDLAAGLADTVDDPFVRDRLLMSVAEKCAAIDDDDYAFQLAEAIEEFGMQEAARELIADQKAAKTDFEKALEIAGSLSHNATALSSIASHYATQNHDAEAERTIEKIDFPITKASALQNIALINFNKGNDEKALELLNKADAAADEINHDEEKIRSFIEIGNHFIDTKHNSRAVEVLDKAKVEAEKLDNVHRDAFLSTISYSLLKAGSLELADRTLDLIEDKTQISNTLAAFAQEFWAKDNKDEALETIEESYSILKSQNEKETRDSRARLQLFAAIAVIFARFDKAERAIEIAQEIGIDEIQSTALSQMAQIFVSQEKENFADQAVKGIAEDSQRLLALIGLSDAEKKPDKKDKAINYLNEALILIETIEQFSVRSSAYNEIAARFKALGNDEKAREILSENLQNISRIRDTVSRVGALADLSSLFEKFEFKLNEDDLDILKNLVRSAMK